MKALAILFRVVFSAIVLLALALYLQVSPTISFGEFCDSLTPAAVMGLFSSINTFTVSLVIVLILSIFTCTRILEALWNVLFSASILILLASGLYALFGPGVALPSPVYQNDTINLFFQALPSYQVAVVLITFIFIAGWLCSTASLRVAITSVVSFGLWYGVTELFSYIVHLWASSATPSLPEALNMIQNTPWVIAAVPAAFFLIYSLLMAFFETYISHATPRKPASNDNTKSESTPVETAKAEDKPKADTKPVEAPKTKIKPKADTKPVEAPKTEDKPEAEAKPEEAPKAEDKPEAEAKPEEAPKAEDKPEAEAKPEGAPKAEDKPEAEAKPEEAPKAEDKPEAEAKPEEALKAEDKPEAEAMPEGAPKAEDKPTAESKTEEAKPEKS